MTNLDSALRSRDVTLLTNIHLDKAIVFPVVMYGCESWTVKKVEHQKIEVFELWCGRRLESPLDCKEIQPVNPKRNQSCVFIGGLMLKLKLQYFSDLMQRTDSLEKTVMLGKTKGRKRGWQRMRWLDASPTRWTWVWIALGVGDGQGILVCCSPWGCKELDTTKRLNWLILF